MIIIESIMYANFEGPRSRDRDLEIPNLKKNCHFCLESYYFAYSHKFAESGTLKFEHHLGANQDRKCTKFGGAQLRDRNFRGQKSAKSG